MADVERGDCSFCKRKNVELSKNYKAKIKRKCADCQREYMRKKQMQHRKKGDFVAEMDDLPPKMIEVLNVFREQITELNQKLKLQEEINGHLSSHVIALPSLKKRIKNLEQLLTKLGHTIPE